MWLSTSKVCLDLRDNYKQIEDQKRLSVLDGFITKKSEFDKNQEALEEYREKWTKSKHVFDDSRTYLGAPRKNWKVDPWLFYTAASMELVRAIIINCTREHEH